jgi:hypothetical protein
MSPKCLALQHGTVAGRTIDRFPIAALHMAVVRKRYDVAIRPACRRHPTSGLHESGSRHLIAGGARRRLGRWGGPRDAFGQNGIDLGHQVTGRTRLTPALGGNDRCSRLGVGMTHTTLRMAGSRRHALGGIGDVAHGTIQTQPLSIAPPFGIHMHHVRKLHQGIPT